MRTLIIGGTRFVGYFLTWRLLAAGHQVTLFHRGTTPDPFGSPVRHLHGDRTTPDFARLLSHEPFDAIIDFAAYTAADVQQVIRIFTGKIQHYVFISTGQVYLVRQNCPRPASESDYDGPVIPEPARDSPDYKDWLYGIDKRAAEDALAAAFATTGFPATRLRIPMVNGPRDYYRRIESYLWRILDGGPILLPDGERGGQICRHVYGPDVANTIAQILGHPQTFGQAYNLCQDEQPSPAELVTLLAEFLNARPRILPISPAALAQAHLLPKQISPFSDTWMSHLNPARAKAQLHFTHQPLSQYLQTTITAFLAHPLADRPANYAHRATELGLAANLAPPKS